MSQQKRTSKQLRTEVNRPTGRLQPQPDVGTNVDVWIWSIPKNGHVNKENDDKPMRLLNLLRQSHISTISADQHHYDEEIWLCSQPPTDTDHSTVTCRHHARDVEPACNFQKITQGHNVRMAVAVLTVQPMHGMKSFHQIG
jgi:hypothetical protein